MTGIYQIQSIIKPERIYIGSSININKRWQEHKRDLLMKRHRSPKLQRHYNKYGSEDYQYTVLKECEKEDLIKNEQYYIDTLNPYFNTFKIANSPLGTKRTQAEKDKISRANKGKWGNKKGTISTEETKQKMRDSFYRTKVLQYEKLGLTYYTSKEKKEIARIKTIEKKEARIRKKLSKRKPIRRNRRIEPHSSQYKGVYIRYQKYKGKTYKSILAHIVINKKLIYLGSFETEKEAAITYDKKALEHYGNLVVTNFNYKT